MRCKRKGPVAGTFKAVDWNLWISNLDADDMAAIEALIFQHKGKLQE